MTSHKAGIDTPRVTDKHTFNFAFWLAAGSFEARKCLKMSDSCCIESDRRQHQTYG